MRSFLCTFVLALWSVSALAAGPHPSLPPPVIPDCLGVNIHFTDAKPGELEMLAAAGFKWVRMDLGWGGTERTKGEYDFSAYDRLVASLDRRQLRAVFILDYGNPLYADPGDKQPFTSRAGTEEFRAAYARWAAAAVAHFQKRGYLWELWNEPNHAGFWKPAPDASQYAAVALSAAKAIRAAAPGEAIIGPATSTIDLPFLETCFQAGLLEYLDAVSVHPYRQQAPDTVVEEYRSLRLLIAKYNRQERAIPVVSGEWGYSTAWKDFDDAKQARYLPRQFLTNIANEVALSIWYDWHDDGTNPKEAEHRFGIVGHEYHAGRDPVYDPKPAYQAMKLLTGQLGGFRFNKRLCSFWFGLRETISKSWNEGSTFLLFEKENEQRLAMWRATDQKRPGVIYKSQGSLRISPSPFGEKETVDTQGFLQRWADAFSLEASSLEPAYVQFENPNELLQLAAAAEKLPLEIVAPSQEAFPIQWQIVNTTKRDLEVAPWSGEMGVPKEFFQALGAGRKILAENKQPVGGSEARRAGEATVGASFLLAKGQPAYFAMATTLIPSDPVRVTILPRFGKMVPVEIENLSASPLPAMVRLSSPDEDSRPIPVEASSRQVTVLFDVGLPGKDRPVRYLATVERRGGADVKMLPLPDSVLNEARVWSDGAAEVPSQQSLRSEAAPEGLPVQGQTAMAIDYRFGVGWKFLQVDPQQPAPIPGEPRSLGLMLYGDARGGQMRVRFQDQTGQTFQGDGPKIDWKGWRYVTAPLNDDEAKPLAHWGGANDGKIHYPIRWQSIFLLDNTSRQSIEGRIYLCAPTLIY